MQFIILYYIDSLIVMTNVLVCIGALQDTKSNLIRFIFLNYRLSFQNMLKIYDLFSWCLVFSTFYSICGFFLTVFFWCDFQHYKINFSRLGFTCIWTSFNFSHELLMRIDTITYDERVDYWTLINDTKIFRRTIYFWRLSKSFRLVYNWRCFL